MEEKYLDEFLTLLKKSISNIKEKEVEMAFSGGLDSSILAKIMINSGKKVIGYVAGMENSKDILQARKAAKEIRIELREIILDEKEIEDAIGIQGRIIKKIYDKIENKEKYNQDMITPNAIPVSFNLPLFFVAREAKSKKVIVSQGPDEMLGGYTRHLKLGREESICEMKKNTEDFLEVGLKQNTETGKYWNCEFIMPYLNQEIVEFCLSLPYEMKINNNIRKYILRKLAERLGLSKELAFNKKKASQYGSGIIDVMKKLAKQRGHHISWLVNKKMK